MTSDSYHTLAGPAEAIYKEKSSKFLAYAYPVESEEEIRTLLDALRKKYYDATHHCYAWRLGPHGETFRANDDGEPSGTAGMPTRSRRPKRSERPKSWSGRSIPSWRWSFRTWR